MHARIATYTYTGDAQAIARKAEDGLLPILQAQAGFKAYSVMATDEKIISFSAWDSAESAEAANSAALQWVQENIADQIEHKSTHFGEILIGTTLGISTKAGATV
jgi:hypothetical protein